VGDVNCDFVVVGDEYFGDYVVFVLFYLVCFVCCYFSFFWFGVSLVNVVIVFCVCF